MEKPGLKFIIIFTVCLIAALPLWSANTLVTAVPELVRGEAGSEIRVSLRDYVINLAATPGLTVASVVDDNAVLAIQDNTLVIASEHMGFNLIGCHLQNTDGNQALFWIPVNIVEKKPVTFRYKPDGPVNAVSVAGEFNGWNKDADLLTDADRDGTFELEKIIPAGRYTYKIVVNGSQWLPDPNAVLTAPDGFGGNNSVVEVGAAGALRVIPISRTVGDESITYTLTLAKPGKIRALGLINNEIMIPEQLSVSGVGNKTIITLILPKGQKNQVILWALGSDGAVGQYRFCEDKDLSLNDWIDKSIYFAFTDRFYNGDKNNDNPVADPELGHIANYQGGDFKGLSEKITSGYFSRLGIDALWISPVADNTEAAFVDSLPPHRKFSGYHGYWPKSLTAVEEHFGSSQELKDLISEANKNNINVLFDMVFNHIHKESAEFQQHPDWFTPYLLPDGSTNLRQFDKHPFTTWFDEFIPSFDYAKPEVNRMMVENAVWWIKEFGLAGFRVDAVKHIPEDFFIDLRREITRRVGPDFFMVGETIDSRERIKQYISPAMLDSQFDFPLYWTIRDFFAKKSVGLERLVADAELSDRIYGSAPVAPLLGNHDFPRFMAFADPGINLDNGRDKEIAFTAPPQIDPAQAEDLHRKLRFAFEFLLTRPGIPMIYYGDEIGLTGAADPDNRRPMIFEDQWNDSQKKTFATVAALLKLRKEHPALRRGVWQPLAVAADRAFIRVTYFNDDLLLTINNRDANRLPLLPPATELADRNAMKGLYNVSETPIQEGTDWYVETEPFSIGVYQISH